MWGFQPIAMNSSTYGPAGCPDGEDIDFEPAGSSLSQQGYVGVAFSFDLNSCNYGGSAVLWSLSSLPPGLSLNTATGVISGTPTTEGFYTMTLSAKAECSLDFVSTTFYLDIQP